MHLSQLLPLCSLLYLALPYFLFAYGWLKSWLAVVFILCLLAGLILSSKEILRWPPPSCEKKGWKTGMDWGLTLLIAIAWVSLSGVGGVGLQNTDYTKHNAILKDLMQSSWPVYYDHVPPTGASFFQSYYTAWYLPAALTGKAWGWVYANRALYVWTTLGVYLSLRWFRQCVGTGSYVVCPLFILLGGLDLIGFSLLNKGLPRDGTMHIEWWLRDDTLPMNLKRIFQYSSNTTLLFYVPQHCLPGWIITGMITHLSIEQVSRRIILFAASLCCLWSPFIAIGLIPVVLASLYHSKIRELISFPNLVVAPLIVLIVAVFLSGKNPEAIPHGAIWNLYNLYDLLPRLLIFLVLEVFIYAVFCNPSLPQWHGRGGPLLLLTLATLVVLPAYRIGENNDLMMRASIPSLFVMWVFLVGNLTNREGGLSPLARRCLLLIILVGAMSGGAEILRSLKEYTAQVPSWGGTVGVPSLVESLNGQYLGREDSLFFKYLAPPPVKPTD